MNSQHVEFHSTLASNLETPLEEGCALPHRFYDYYKTGISQDWTNRVKREVQQRGIMIEADDCFGVTINAPILLDRGSKFRKGHLRGAIKQDCRFCLEQCQYE